MEYYWRLQKSRRIAGDIKWPNSVKSGKNGQSDRKIAKTSIRYSYTYVTVKSFIFFAHEHAFKRLNVVCHEQCLAMAWVFLHCFSAPTRNCAAMIRMVVTKVCLNQVKKARRRPEDRVRVSMPCTTVNRLTTRLYVGAEFSKLMCKEAELGKLTWNARNCLKLFAERFLLPDVCN